jgi:hypothetical protein
MPQAVNLIMNESVGEYLSFARSTFNNGFSF